MTEPKFDGAAAVRGADGKQRWIKASDLRPGQLFAVTGVLVVARISYLDLRNRARIAGTHVRVGLCPS